VGVVGRSSSESEKDKELEDAWVQDAEIGLDESVGENESDLTRMSSVTLAPDDRA
jgi:hypothetical protein